MKNGRASAWFPSLAFSALAEMVADRLHAWSYIAASNAPIRLNIAIPITFTGLFSLMRFNAEPPPDQPQASEPDDVPDDPNQPTKKRVLVVEDDLSSRDALQYLLKRAGCEVTVAETLAESYAALDPAHPPDSVVLDLLLPDGDGSALLEHLRKMSPKTRIVVATGVVDPAWLQRVQALKPDSILRKPLVMAELLREL